MPYITTTSNTDEGLITLLERLTPSDIESELYCAHPLGRLRCATEDAHGAGSLYQLDRTRNAARTTR